MDNIVYPAVMFIPQRFLGRTLLFQVFIVVYISLHVHMQSKGLT